MSDQWRGFLVGGVAMLKEIYPNCTGLDVHKKFVTACRLAVGAQGVTRSERHKFSNHDRRPARPGRLAGRWTVARCSHGVYWQPIYNAEAVQLS